MFLVWFLLALGFFIIIYYLLFVPPTTLLNDLLAVNVIEENDSLGRKLTCFGISIEGTSIGNAGFILVVFVIFITSYDAQDTFKPSWTEWLG